MTTTPVSTRCALAGVALMLVVGCDRRPREDGGVTSRTTDTVTTATSSAVANERHLALVRVVNAMPGGAPVNIWAGDSVAFGSVKYKDATPYREISDNAFTFRVRVGAAGESLAENRENLNNGGHYTIVAMPDKGGADKANLRVLDDDLQPAPAGKARVRFINAVPGGQDVDVIVRGRSEALFDGVNFKTEAGWKDIDPVTGTLEVRPDGKESIYSSLPGTRLEVGKSYTFVWSGRTGKYDLTRIVDEVMPGR